jgi:hypothetical protein
MSFAYNANTSTNQSTGEIMDHAKDLLDYLDLKRDGMPKEIPHAPRSINDFQVSRPIIFVAYSLGGLAVKQVIRI